MIRDDDVLMKMAAVIGVEVDKKQLTAREKELKAFARRVSQHQDKEMRATERRARESSKRILAEQKRAAAAQAGLPARLFAAQRSLLASQRGQLQSQRQMTELRAAEAAKKKAGSSVGTLGGVAALGGLGLGAAAAGGFMAYKGLKDSLNFDQQLTDLDIGSKGAMGSLERVRAAALAVSKDTSLAKEEILAGAQAFVALTGDGDAAMKSMATFAKVKLATNATTSDIAETAAALSSQFGILPDQMEKMFSILHAGGKEGAVEFSNLAKLAPEVGAAIKKFSDGTGVGGASLMGSLLQFTRPDFGSSDEAATGVKRMLESFTQPRTIKALKKFNIELYQKDDKGVFRLRAVRDILGDIAKSDIMKDPDRQIAKIMESTEGRTALKGVLERLGAVDDLIKKTKNANDIEEDAAKRRNSNAFKFAQTMNSLKVTITEVFSTERVGAFVEMLKDGIEAAGTLAGAIGDLWSTSSDRDKEMARRAVDDELAAGNTLEGVAAGNFKVTAPGLFGTDQDEARRSAKRRMLGDQADETLRRTNLLMKWGDLAKQHGFDDTRAMLAERAYKQAVNATVNLTVTVPPGTDAQGIGSIIQRQLREGLDTLFRQTDAAMGGQE